MAKKVIIFLCGPSVFFLIIIVALATAGGGAPNAAVMPIVATEEKAEEYAITVSKLGAPWDIVLVTDAVLAYDDGQAGIETLNPLYTALQFQTLAEQVEHYEVIGQEIDQDTGETIDIYDWVYAGNNQYDGREEILDYVGVALNKESPYSAEQFTAAVISKAAAKSGSEWRYTATLIPNRDFKIVLQDFVGLDEATTQRIIDLYEANYIETMQLSAEAIERIRAIQSECGVYQFVDGAYVNCEGITFTDGGREVVYYNQLDRRWAASPYGRVDTIGKAGCGPTAMSIVISTLTGDRVDPVYMADWAYTNGYCCPRSGSYRTLIKGAGEAFGLSVQDCGINEGQRVADALADGKLVVAIMGPGHFTNCGHFIVLRGVSGSGDILVADPASTSRSQKTWPISLILSEVSGTNAGVGPLWIIG